MNAGAPQGGVYIAIGANLGERDENIRAGLQALQRGGRTSVLRVSTFHQTPAVGGPAGQPDYLNAAAELATTLPPRELLHEMLTIERELGRSRANGLRNAPRTLDLDLLLYGDLVLDEPGLVIPHPRMWQRDFVLAPLSEICDLPFLRRQFESAAAAAGREMR